MVVRPSRSSRARGDRNGGAALRKPFGEILAELVTENPRHEREHVSRAHPRPDAPPPPYEPIASTPRAFLPIIESVGMRTGRRKSYIAAVMDAKGVTHEYVYVSAARNRRDAEDEAGESLRHWGGTLVEMTPVVEHGSAAPRRRLVAVAGFTIALSGIAIGATMIIGLSLEGAL